MSDEIRRKGRPKAFSADPKASTIQALDRAFDVLDVIAAHSGLTLSEIATALDQSPATMHRVLATLEARQVVETDPVRQTWHIGAAAFRLGSAFLRRSSVVERARPVMRALMEETGETSNLGIERNSEVMFLSQVETHESIRAFFPPGTLSPMHASGIGKALLAAMPEDAVSKRLRHLTLERFTDKTILTTAELQADLVQIQRRGWAFDDEEKALGMRCVAAPIRNLHGEPVAGLSISGPVQRLPLDRIEHIGARVRAAAQQLSQDLGAPDGPNGSPTG
ncbi:Acetate operon repressor [Thalassovita autumnalis]|uniref:Acetate operon repressor n=1 Tax=Thalassovita autumnalis TaxID=2072972 RepID=A0A0P1FU40_9RHOB|nr:HTH-type transcriptional regulator BhcR [Thalassovita autumnalis]CUH63261.1 Acetate operon repressor [Thalassovita autumnalis]CUH72000.1 Acetate operon repressor [Thalassovita autumnalis]